VAVSTSFISPECSVVSNLAQKLCALAACESALLVITAVVFNTWTSLHKGCLEQQFYKAVEHSPLWF